MQRVFVGTGQFCWLSQCGNYNVNYDKHGNVNMVYDDAKGRIVSLQSKVPGPAIENTAMFATLAPGGKK